MGKAIFASRIFIPGDLRLFGLLQAKAQADGCDVLWVFFSKKQMSAVLQDGKNQDFWVRFGMEERIVPTPPIYCGSVYVMWQWYAFLKLFL